MTETKAVPEADIVLVGAGIMSMTLAVLLKELQPSLKIEIIEALASEAQESSNAGTTPAPAMRRCASSTTRRCARTAASTSPRRSRSIPSSTFPSVLVVSHRQGRDRYAGLVHPPGPAHELRHGADRVAYLKKRHAALTAHHCYFGMEYTEDKKQLAEWGAAGHGGPRSGRSHRGNTYGHRSDVNYGA